MERVLVTGAATLVGRRLVEYLRRRAFWVRAVDHREYAGPANETVRLEPTDFEGAREITAGVGHVYALDGPMARERPPDGRAHEQGSAGGPELEIEWTENLAAAAAKAGVHRYLYAAPGCVHHEPGPDHPCCAAQRESTRLLQDLERRTGMESRVALPANVYGRWKAAGEAAASPVHELALMAAGVPASPNGVFDVGTDAATAFCALEDCVDGLYLLMRSNHRAPLLIASTERASLGEVTAILARMSERPLPITESERGRVFPAPAPDDEIRTRLGWLPPTPLAAGLADLYAHALEAGSHG
ncbi:NAD-dependent epimerase/dehydratase family protein [Actinomadura rubrisoli]|uniref:NAD-dependent epimerase/dehydratase family protein n=1 Tax=Actinomadura rubrisoli TaxID=2530368 RepID=A0A4R5CA68_9ACTN|nr:NAD-dependent epimerase/dehydratase family protein [Actinomadura rubrisoli]TDD96788.1 NAD-dependent epimerase/dehydratase family protein [Actinomadura rubrisoli]